MATVNLEKVSKVYPNGLPAVSELDLDVAEGELMVLVGRPGRARRLLFGWWRDSRTSPRARFAWAARPSTTCPEGPQRGHGVPELRPVPAHDSGAEHRLCSEAAEVPQGRDQHQGPRGRPAPRPERLLELKARTAVRWPAPACRHGTRDRARAFGVLDGRAALQPGRQAARPDARRDLPHPKARGCGDLYVTTTR